MAAPTLPDVGLPGVNDPACRSEHRPVLLLHGTLSTPASNFGPLAAALRASGRCVYAVLYGARFGYGGIGPVRESSTEVAGFVGQVLAASGQGRLDVVGYSQGGLVLRTMLRYDLDPAVVATGVLIAPSFHGTTAQISTSVPAGLCAACADQAANSTLLTDLNAGGDLAGAVRYAEVSTRNDRIVTPVSSQVPAGPPTRVRSVIVEDQCPRLVTDHMTLPGAAPVARWVVAALESDGRPKPADLGCS